MARITMRKVQETKLSEVFTLYLASAAARGVKDKTLRTYEQHFNAISKRLDVDGNISQITSKDLDKMILKILDDKRRTRYLEGLRVWDKQPDVLVSVVAEAQDRFKHQIELQNLGEYRETLFNQAEEDKEDEEW